MADLEKPPVEPAADAPPMPSVPNPRTAVIEEIAKRAVARHDAEAKEAFDTVDEDGNITPAKPPAEPPPAEPIEAAPVAAPPEAPPAPEPAAAPAAEEPEKGTVAHALKHGIVPDEDYKAEIDGQPITIKGQKLIDAGFRTFQKETAADYRLNLASRMLKDAEDRAKGAPPPSGTPPAAEPPAPKEMSDAEIAKAVQYGTEEQAATAFAALRGQRTATPEQISAFTAEQSRHIARDELLFHDAVSFVESEYVDLFKHDYLKRLFFAEENRLRASGDKRPYKEVYKEIGEGLRKGFNLPKAPPPSTPLPSASGTPAARAAAKAALPPVPKTAAARLGTA